MITTTWKAGKLKKSLTEKKTMKEKYAHSKRVEVKTNRRWFKIEKEHKNKGWIQNSEVCLFICLDKRLL